MSYSLREINEQIRSDPQGFAQRSDSAYREGEAGRPENCRPPEGVPYRAPLRPLRLRQDHHRHED